MICVLKRQAEIMSNLAPELAHKIKVVQNPLPEKVVKGRELLVFELDEG
jgi:hypothetical protein